MNSLKYSVLAALLFICVPVHSAFAEERVLAFDSVITVAGDGSLRVRETIRVNAEHHSIKRGIYRDFPTIYPAEGGRQVVVAFMFGGALRDGQKEQWRQERRANGVRIYLGSADRTVSVGEHVYQIEYQTDRQMGFFEDHDELYWNVTGNGWDFPIERATARLVLPASIPRERLKLEGYTGAFGSRGQAFAVRMDGDAPYFATTQPLGRREGLTIVALWPKGHITQAVESSIPRAPVQGQSRPLTSARKSVEPQRGGFPHYPLILILAAIGLAYTNYHFYRAWDRSGRDPPQQTIIPQYEPPANMSPAAMRYLLDMGGSKAGFTATILSLAVRGFLRIELSKGFVGLGKTYTLTNLRRAHALRLVAEERATLEKVFRLKDVVELKQENQTAIESAIQAHDEILRARFGKGYFETNDDELFKGVAVATLIVLPLVAWTANVIGAEGTSFTPLGWIILLLLAATFVSPFIWGRLLKAPSAKGAALTAHILGFKKYLQVAEGKELEKVTRPPPLTPQLFESYLPAAIALGVQQKWAQQFADVFKMKDVAYSPPWYVGGDVDAHQLMGFTESLGTSLGSAISSAAHAPGSSSGSSGSSDSGGGGGGGGSSGGGGGGGGGGGW